ncbi:hypothetical protein CDL15_Pgr026568 [Punica granatum]|uniref:Uncharacterized protein n=1 Tax=Punica granatum TaxID=22663 RepID=A0A218WLX7_PUNGR|nr:hypothetical protein CDL15_Pgr026568 [Punica granatum]PKI60234.1 hypothetical protein CRG98_019422 [Punica granatum]
MTLIPPPWLPAPTEVARDHVIRAGVVGWRPQPTSSAGTVNHRGGIRVANWWFQLPNWLGLVNHGSGVKVTDLLPNPSLPSNPPSKIDYELGLDFRAWKEGGDDNDNDATLEPERRRLTARSRQEIWCGVSLHGRSEA